MKMSESLQKQSSDWVRGHEDGIVAKFLAAYTEHGFTVDPDSTIQPLDLIRGTTDHKR